MRNPVQRTARTAVALALALVALAWAAFPAPAGERAAVEWVADGDTFRLTDGRWVRLWGIDTPETAHGDSPGQLHAATARAVLKDMVQGREVLIEASGTKPDRHGRLLGWVSLGMGAPTVNEQLVQRGWAVYYPHADQPSWMRDCLLPLQRRAMRESLGVWSDVLGAPGADRPWVGNSASLRAFPAGSPQAGQLSRAHRVPLDDLEAVYRAGFIPARSVSPWPPAGQDNDSP